MLVLSVVVEVGIDSGTTCHPMNAGELLGCDIAGQAGGYLQDDAEGATAEPNDADGLSKLPPVPRGPVEVCVAAASRLEI